MERNVCEFAKTEPRIIHCYAMKPKSESAEQTLEQALTFYPNGYGASVIKSKYSYGGAEGLWELAVLEGGIHEWVITYDTSITPNVMGHLTWSEVEKIRLKIEALPNKNELENLIGVK